MINRNTEFRLGLVGTILSGLGIIGSLIGGIIFFGFISSTYYNDIFYWEKYVMVFTYQDFSYVFLEIILIVLVGIFLLSLISFALGLMGTISLKKRVDVPAKEGIFLVLGGCFGNVLLFTSGIVALGKSPERIIEDKPGNRNLEFGLALAGGILLILSFGWSFIENYLQLVLNNILLEYTPYYIGSLRISFGALLSGLWSGLYQLAMGIVAVSIAFMVKKKSSKEDIKIQGLLLILLGVLGVNPFLLSSGIIGLTKRGKA